MLTIAIALLLGSFAIGQNYLTENFDGAWSGSPSVPSGWSNIHTAAIPGTTGTGTQPVYWAQNTWTGSAWSSVGEGYPTLPGTAYSGSSVAWFKNGTALATQKDQLTTPVINLSTSSYSVITFYLASTNNNTLDPYRYSLKVRGFDGTTWSDIQTIVKPGTDWTKIMVPVPAIYNVAGAQFGIEIMASNSAKDIWIDDFRIDEVGAPISGTKTIGVDYASVALAIKALNESSISGPVTINVPGDYTETFASRHDGLITATGTVANPIIFQKSGGVANPKIIAGPGATTDKDGIIKIAGGDYITFDGIDLSENNTPVTGNLTQTTRAEFGYALLKASNVAPFNGCQNVVIKNCTITLNMATPATTCTGIYSGNHLASVTAQIDLTGGSATDVMNNCQFFSNTVTNVTHGIVLNGWSSTPAPYTMWDQNIEIGVAGANTITNFNSNGINPRYMGGLKVANNNISSSTATPSSLNGIIVQNTTNFDVYNNTITLAPTASNTTIQGITVQYGDAAYTSNIFNNIVQNCTFVTATTASFTGISSSGSAGILNFYSNTVTNNTFPGTGSFTGINCSNAVTLNMYGNTVTNNAKTGISGGFDCFKASSTGAGNIYNNNVYSNTNISVSATAVQGGTMTGISCTGGNPGKLYMNKVYNLTANGGTGIVYGITGSGAYTNIYNNFVSDLKTPSGFNASGNLQIAGINISSGTVNAFFNTVYLNASSTGTRFSTAAIYASTSPTLDLRNNVLVNVSTTGSASTGVAAAYRRSAAVVGLPTYSSNSNANVFYTAASEDATHTTYWDGTTASNFAAYKTLVGPVRDAGSFYELPPFVDVAATPYNLHINTSPATSCESGGVQVTSPIAITDDFDGNPRSTVPDIGADEFSGIAIGVINPGGLSTTLISSSQINVAFTSNPSNDNVVIVWNTTGVFTTPSGIPPASGSFAGGTLLYNGLTSPVNHTGLAGATTYYYKAFSYTGSAYSQGVIVSNITNIAAPTAFTATTINNTQIDLVWTKNAFNNDVLIANNPTNSTFGQPVNGTAYVAGNPITGGGTVIYVGPLSAFNNTGLNGATTYNYKAWSVDALNNNVYSPNGATTSALTWCNPSAIPYTEGFEGGSLGCGSTLDVAADGSTTWAYYYSTSQAHLSTASIRIGTPSSAPSNDWYFTNWLQLTAGVTYEVKFWWKNTTTSNVPHQLEIKYGNSPSVAGMSSAPIYTNTNLSINNTWTQASCSFTPTVTGNTYIGFHSTTLVPPATSPYFYIDDISVSIAPTAYAITGGGSYCQGASGMPVGLANSETDVTFEKLISDHFSSQCLICRVSIFLLSFDNILR